MVSPSDEQWYHKHGYWSGETCAMCAEEIADPDDPEGFCNWCRHEADEDEEC